jgi:membrane protein DedA with SNARE-associated domain
MTLETILHHYGYIALFIGTFLEGETILILAGFAAHRGYLSLPVVWLIAFIGGFMGDQFFFLLGRYRGKALILKRPSWIPKIERANRLIERFQVWIIFGVRFFYGMRIVGPMALGMSRVGIWRFVLLNIASGIIWAFIFSTVGYYFGKAFEILFGNIERVEKYIFLGILTGGLLIYFIRIGLRKSKSDSTG